MMKIKVTIHWIHLDPIFLFTFFLVIVTAMQSN